MNVMNKEESETRRKQKFLWGVRMIPFYGGCNLQLGDNPWSVVTLESSVTREK